MIINFPEVQFIKSIAQLVQLPPDTGFEVAFIGRSNAGKSSAINAITGNKKLAKTSRTPGRTQLINFFEISPERRIVDLPGYGYAKVPNAVKQNWEKNVELYLQTRNSLRQLIIVIDCRHPLSPLDLKMLRWTQHQKISFSVLLTKADKLTRSAAFLALKKIENHCNEFSFSNSSFSIELFSAVTGQGVNSARQQLLTRLGIL